MRESLPTALELIRQHEGGYVDHPRDPGGCTNFGITLATFRRHADVRATCADLRRISWPTAAAIYEREYWRAVRGDDLPAGVDVSVFDMGVNAGPVRAVTLLQRALGVMADGIIGPATLSAARTANARDLIWQYATERLRYYRSLDGWTTFGRGWSIRINATRTVSVDLLK